MSKEMKDEKVLNRVEDDYQVFLQEMWDTCLYECETQEQAVRVLGVLKTEYPKYVVEHWEHCTGHREDILKEGCCDE
jgi:hypothetical protein